MNMRAAILLLLLVFSGNVNVYWQPLGPLSFAVEGIYGTHVDEFDRFGDNTRNQFVFEYSF